MACVFCMKFVPSLLHGCLVKVVPADQFAGCKFCLPQPSHKGDVQHCAVVTVSNRGAGGDVSGERSVAVGIAVSAGIAGGGTAAVALQRQEQAGDRNDSDS